MSSERLLAETQTGSSQVIKVEPGVSSEDVILAKEEMMRSMTAMPLRTIFVFMDITGRRPWGGRKRLMIWLLSTLQKRYLAQLACHLFINEPAPATTPELFNGYPHVEETNFDEVSALFLSDGLKTAGKNIMVSVSKFVVTVLICCFILLGLQMILPPLKFP